MTPADLRSAGMKMYGKTGWRHKLATDLGVNPVTIWRMMKKERIAGPYEVAVRGMLENKKRRDEIEKAARKLLPRGYKKWNKAPRKKAKGKADLSRRNGVKADDRRPARQDTAQAGGDRLPGSAQSETDRST